MAKASKTHFLIVRVKFDKPVHKKEAAYLAGQVLVNDYYPYGADEKMDVTSVKTKPGK